MSRSARAGRVSSISLAATTAACATTRHTGPPTAAASSGLPPFSSQRQTTGAIMPDQTLPPQHQTRQPGREYEMHPPPESEGRHYRSAHRLTGRVALISGGDSGIG